MDSLEYFLAMENLSLNFNSTYNTTNLSSNFLPISVENTTLNQSEEHQKLYQVPTVAVVVLSIFYGAICILAILGNFLVLVLVIASKRMRAVTNLFIANLALADILIAMFTIPFQFRAALLQRWDLPHFLCALCPFIQVLTVTVSILTLVLIALDRYRAVMHPFKAKLSKNMALGAILAIWVISLLLALPTKMDYSVIKVTINGTTKDFCTNVYLPATFRMYYIQGIVIIQYFLPLLIISKAYFQIGRTILSSNTPGNQQEVRDALVSRKKEKAIKMLFTVVFIFALCWFPLQTYNFLSVMFPSINSFEYINILWFCFHWLAMSNSCCNPFIYTFYSNKFKKELIRRLACFARTFRDSCLKHNTIHAQSNNLFNELRVMQPNNCNIQVIYNPLEPTVQIKMNSCFF